MQLPTPRLSQIGPSMPRLETVFLLSLFYLDPGACVPTRSAIPRISFDSTAWSGIR